jgi:NTP pyrophosphatase (non-canonical NTP hydrolase)
VDIKRFQEQVKQLSQKLDTPTPERRVMYLVSELGEVVDEVIDLVNVDEDTPQQVISEMKERLGLELYDLIWNAVDLANMLEIDLEVAFKTKAAINEKRKWKRSGYVDCEQ